MKATFEAPDFSTRSVELRVEQQEVCIYGTEEGLRMLADLCLKLAQGKHAKHIHLEDHEILTSASLRGTIVMF